MQSTMTTADLRTELKPPRDSAGPLETFVSPARHWKLLAGAALAAGIVGAATSMLVSPRFTVSASFITDEVDQTQLPSGLASIAGQFGISTGGSGVGSTQFYADLLRSRSVVRALLSATVPAGGRSVRVIDLLNVHDDDPIRRIEGAETAMSDRISVDFDRTTGRIGLKVWMERPETAKAVADTLLALINQFDRETRRTRAGEKRIFTEHQKALAADSLRAAEDAMTAFLERNHSYHESAQLEFQHERLARAITLRQDIFLALARDVEQARLRELDARPVVTTIDAPVMPGRRAWPKRKIMVTVFILVTVAFLWIFLVLRELAAVTPGDSDVGRAIGLLRSAMQDLVRRPRRKA
jgi:uncharacterized protein involved in exopolysaccharide biosynthesis